MIVKRIFTQDLQIAKSLISRDEMVTIDDNGSEYKEVTQNDNIFEDDKDNDDNGDFEDYSDSF